MKNKLLLVLSTALLDFGLSSFGSKKTLVQVICEESKTAPGSRFITYFWSDGSSDFYGNKVTTVGYPCPTPARKEDTHFYFEYPPVKTP
jgi:hypothetical protein